MMQKQISRKTINWIAVLVFLMGVFLDQGTKYLAVQYLKGEEPVVLVNQVLQLEYVENRGAAFGIFQNRQVIFFVVSLFVSAVAVYFFIRMPMENRVLPIRACLVFIVAGGIGNCLDRIRQQYVVDFIYFKLIDFPVFNVADIFVTVGMVVLIILLLFVYKEEDFDRLFHR